MATENRLIKAALRLYLERLEKAEYIKSYQRAAKDADVLAMAETGMADYFHQLAGDGHEGQSD